MLLFHASIMIGTIVYVGSKNDTYVDPNYYAKSIDWDAQREMKEAIDTQGWTVTINAKPVEDDPRLRKVTIDLRDAQGEPIDDAMVELVCYHPAALSNRYDAVMLYEDGVYARIMPIERVGNWKADLTIQRQGVRALVTKDLDIVPLPHTATQ